MTLLTSILQITIAPEKLISKLLKVGADKLNRFDVDSDKKIAKKSKKSKSEKSSKSQKSAKSEKKLSKSGNAPNFDIKENRLSFLILKTRSTSNCLWLIFINTLIF